MSATDLPPRRSDCPLSIAAEILGDRWSLLILRDLIFKRATSFTQFQQASEGIATNVLADRLRKLRQRGLVECHRSTTDTRMLTYRPTVKALDLLPTLVELILWTSAYERTAAPPQLLREMKTDRDRFIRGVRSAFS